VALTEKQIDKRFDDLADKCRSAGIRLTRQRVEILSELAGSQSHPDADSIYEAVRRRLPRLSLDTVYRTLGSLEALGVIGKLSAFHGAARFDPDTAPHHHGVCIRCGRVSDIPSPDLDQLNLPASVRSWGEIRSVHAELRGICRQCLRAGDASVAD
jgi:Fur family peroxide stress response transcriptional regulator